jgi:hypothetical protein
MKGAHFLRFRDLFLIPIDSVLFTASLGCVYLHVIENVKPPSRSAGI